MGEGKAAPERPKWPPSIDRPEEDITLIEKLEVWQRAATEWHRWAEYLWEVNTSLEETFTRLTRDANRAVELERQLAECQELIRTGREGQG